MWVLVGLDNERIRNRCQNGHRNRRGGLDVVVMDVSCIDVTIMGSNGVDCGCISICFFREKCKLNVPQYIGLYDLTVSVDVTTIRDHYRTLACVDMWCDVLLVLERKLNEC